MAAITIRDLDDAPMRRLSMRAAECGLSVEEAAREILREAVGADAPERDLGEAIRRRFAAVGGVELELPQRGPWRGPSAARS